MPLNKPIIVIDDDADDREILESIFTDLHAPEQRIYFDNSIDAYAYLTSTSDQPLIIICDINLPRQTGVEFKTQIDKVPHLRQKSIPFVFLSTAASRSIIEFAYSQLVVQGFFEKPFSIGDYKSMINNMLCYWRCCKHPNI